MSLEHPNLAEQQLLSRLEQVTGSMEEKHKQLQQSGVFKEYGEIYEAYADLIEAEGEGIEALKRATFLMWYEQAEPACFSGVFGLSEEVGRKILATLERRLKAGKLDVELEWMLPYYNLIADWAFSQNEDLPHLRSFLAKAGADTWQRVGIKAEDFTNRGQMGEYWLSIISSNVTRAEKLPCMASSLTKIMKLLKLV